MAVIVSQEPITLEVAFTEAGYAPVVYHTLDFDGKETIRITPASALLVDDSPGRPRRCLVRLTVPRTSWRTTYTALGEAFVEPDTRYGVIMLTSPLG